MTGRWILWRRVLLGSLGGWGWGWGGEGMGWEEEEMYRCWVLPFFLGRGGEGCVDIGFTYFAHR